MIVIYSHYKNDLNIYMFGQIASQISLVCNYRNSSWEDPVFIRLWLVHVEFKDIVLETWTAASQIC